MSYQTTFEVASYLQCMQSYKLKLIGYNIIVVFNSCRFYKSTVISNVHSLFQKYINYILMNPILASSLPVKRFLDPDNYSSSFQGNSTICFKMAFLSFQIY